VSFISHEENIKRWKELIEKTEEQIENWKDIATTMPYYENVCKVWEHFLYKQKEDINYYLKIKQSFE
jgi:hypothetical protein